MCCDIDMCCDSGEQLCNRDKQKRKETQNLRGSPTLRWLRPRAETGNKLNIDCIQIVFRVQDYAPYFYINRHTDDELGPIQY